MKLINKNTDYAARALIFIAQRKGELVSTMDLENYLGLPRPFLRKILQVLQINSILESIKGNKGGFKLNKDPKDILLIDLMKIFQGDFKLTDCIFKKNICPNAGTCLIRKQVSEIEVMVFSKLKKVTLKSLAKG